ncbi:hypothetical protein ACFLU1_04700 [Chloroflexota bacterium]
MKKLIVKLSILIISIPFLLMLVGCHGFIEIWGKVYEWVDAPAGSQSVIFIRTLEDWRDYEIVIKELEERISPDIKKSPLNHVQITVSGKELGADESYYTVTSNISGQFKLWQLANGGDYPVEIKASRIGYIGVDGKTAYDSFSASDFAIVVVLVKDENWEWKSK